MTTNMSSRVIKAKKEVKYPTHSQVAVLSLALLNTMKVNDRVISVATPYTIVAVMGVHC